MGLIVLAPATRLEVALPAEPIGHGPLRRNVSDRSTVFETRVLAEASASYHKIRIETGRLHA